MTDMTATLNQLAAILPKTEFTFELNYIGGQPALSFVLTDGIPLPLQSMTPHFVPTRWIPEDVFDSLQKAGRVDVEVDAEQFFHENIDAIGDLSVNAGWDCISSQMPDFIKELTDSDDEEEEDLEHDELDGSDRWQ